MKKSLGVLLASALLLGSASAQQQESFNTTSASGNANVPAYLYAAFPGETVTVALANNVTVQSPEPLGAKSWNWKVVRTRPSPTQSSLGIQLLNVTASSEAISGDGLCLTVANQKTSAKLCFLYTQSTFVYDLN